MTPNPQPRNGPVIRRDLYCLDADACLTLAGRSGWPGLDCSACPVAGQRREVGAPERAPLYIFRASEVVEGAAAVPVVDITRQPSPLPQPDTVGDRLLVILREAGRPMRTGEITDALGVGITNCSATLSQLVARGLVRKLKHGVYALAGAEEPKRSLADELLEWAELCGARWHIKDAQSAFAGWSISWIKNTIKQLVETGRLVRVGYGFYEVAR